MIKIISFKLCPFVQRVTAALEAKGIDYEIDYISLKDKPQWFLDISPNGQVPVLVTHSGTALFESDAIVEYIEDEYGPLEQDVSNEQRALDRAWSYLGSKHYLVQCGTMRTTDGEAFKTKSETLINAFAKVEKHLDGTNRFFKSDSMSNVDMAWLPLLHRSAIVEEHTGYDFLAGLPKVKSWQKALLSADWLNNTVSADFEKLFREFYLTETFLGGRCDEVASENCCAPSCCN